MIGTTLSSGVWPAMITPLKPDNTMDWAVIDDLIEWYLDAGVAGLFAVGQSAEMFALTNDERIALASHVVKQVDGRVPIVATGSFGQTTEDQAEFIKRMAATGVQAVTIVLAALAPQELASDDTLKIKLEYLLEATGDTPLALYECPEPYHLRITPDLLGWAAHTGRFTLLKETSRSLAAVQSKVDSTAGTSLKCLNADATTLLDSLKGGAQGYCGIAANFYPRLLVWLFENFQTQPEQACDLQALLGIFDVIIHHKYPISAKYFLHKLGFNVLPISRLRTTTLDGYDQRALDRVAELMQSDLVPDQARS